MSSFSELIAGLGREIGLGFSGDIASPVEIRVDTLTVTLSSGDPEGAQELVFATALGIVPEGREVEAYRVMLDANVYWTATAGCTLGVNADTREAMLCFRAPLDRLDPKRLADMLETFVYVAGNWANFVEGLDADGPATAADEHSQIFIRI